jgi:hypothetical protein
MLWRSIRNALGLREEPVKPDSSAKIRDLAVALDQHYDALLAGAPSIQVAIAIEEERQAAHDALTRDALGRALAGFERPQRMR